MNFPGIMGSGFRCPAAVVLTIQNGLYFLWTIYSFAILSFTKQEKYLIHLKFSSRIIVEGYFFPEIQVWNSCRTNAGISFSFFLSISQYLVSFKCFFIRVGHGKSCKFTLVTFNWKFTNEGFEDRDRNNQTLVICFCCT